MWNNYKIRKTKKRCRNNGNTRNHFRTVNTRFFQLPAKVKGTTTFFRTTTRRWTSKKFWTTIRSTRVSHYYCRPVHEENKLLLLRRDHELRNEVSAADAERKHRRFPAELHRAQNHGPEHHQTDRGHRIWEPEEDGFRVGHAAEGDPAVQQHAQ